MSKIIRIDTIHSGDRHSCATNGDGMRIVCWWLGCGFHCPGCHNRQYWDFDDPEYEEFGEKHIRSIIDEMTEYEQIYSGLSILGGEPFSERNIKDVLKLCREFISKFPTKNIWIWSGYTLEELESQTGEYGSDINELLSICSYLVDGRFVLSRRNISLKFRGSDNQRIINLKTRKVIS